MDQSKIDHICQLYQKNGQNALAVSRETGVTYKRVLRVLAENQLKESQDGRIANSEQTRDQKYLHIIEVYKQNGGSKRAVSRILNCTRNTVQKALDAYPVNPSEIVYPEYFVKNKPFPDEVKQEIIERYIKGESTVQLGREFGRDPDMIRKLLTKNGVPARKNGKPFGRKNGRTERHHYFAKQAYLVAEVCLGRLVCNDEVVHHHDENPSNNNPRNLWLFPNNQSHSGYHSRKAHLELSVLSKESIHLAREYGGFPLLEMIDQTLKLPDKVYQFPLQKLD